ncbi:hypothetical protein OG252_45045 [Streptomyces sp. NBC_01352]|uniref:hypothetical protein n=1 Tax=Streptomyces sp. NBC_01352 TaxID=2903834 RepID=UPI002E34BEB3|nr:hypothetical protein [Streptomyces sp. NBC_01352]
MTAPTGLLVEHDRALGLGKRKPRLSWLLPSDATGRPVQRQASSTSATALPKFCPPLQPTRTPATSSLQRQEHRRVGGS